MATSTTRTTTTLAPFSNTERSSKTKQNRTDIWTSLLRQTQSRNRSNAVAHRHLVVCGGSSSDQHEFLSSLTRPAPPQLLKKNRGDGKEQRDQGRLVLSNRYAYGYGHVSLFSTSHGGLGGGSLGAESEVAAKLDCHCVPEPEAAYEGLLRRLLAPSAERETGDEPPQDDLVEGSEGRIRRPAVTILLSWKQPWAFLQKLRAWLQLLAKALLPTSTPVDEDPIDILREHSISITVVAQHVEAQQALEREGWTEETFDYVCQVLRTAILPLHPISALLFTSSAAAPQPPGSPLTEGQKVLFAALDLDLAALSPRGSAATSGGSAPPKKEDLAPRHNVVDRMNIVVPASWDSLGKIRLLSENFSPEEVLSSWTADLLQPVFLPPPTKQPEQSSTTLESGDAQSEAPSKRQEEEVFTADASSPVDIPEDAPPSPSKTAPSAIRSYEVQIVDPKAHRAAKPPTITVTTREEQDFLKEMKSELDALAAKDRERNAANASSSTPSPASRVVGPSGGGESSGALDGLGDVSFNVGGVSYNTASAEAAIDRLKRGQTGAAAGQDSPASTMAGASASMLATSSRSGTPRPPRRGEREQGEREGTPSIASPPGTGRSNFPSEDLEKYFASLAKKAGGGLDSRQGTPSRQ